RRAARPAACPCALPRQSRPRRTVPGSASQPGGPAHRRGGCGRCPWAFSKSECDIPGRVRRVEEPVAFDTRAILTAGRGRKGEAPVKRPTAPSDWRDLADLGNVVAAGNGLVHAADEHDWLNT